MSKNLISFLNGRFCVAKENSFKTLQCTRSLITFKSHAFVIFRWTYMLNGHLHCIIISSSNLSLPCGIFLHPQQYALQFVFDCYNYYAFKKFSFDTRVSAKQWFDNTWIWKLGHSIYIGLCRFLKYIFIRSDKAMIENIQFVFWSSMNGGYEKLELVDRFPSYM